VANLTKTLHGQQATVHAIHAPTSEPCFWCAGPHSSDECAQGNKGQQASFINNRPPYNQGPMSTYQNGGWRGHQNNMPMQPAPQAQPRPTQNQPRPPPYQAPPLRAYKNETNLEELVANLATSTTAFVNTTTDFMHETKTALSNQSAQIRNLETQVGQLANAIHTRPQGTLPSAPEVNPREHCNAISHQHVAATESPKKEEKEAAPVTKAPKPHPPVHSYEPPLPFPQRLTVALSAECSALLKQELPPKLEDPGKFTLPCTIGDIFIENALCDLGSGINLMPSAVFTKLGVGELKPTRTTLQLADRTVRHPRGFVEDLLVKVGKFTFPADFYVIEMDEDREIPILFGRAFLATCGVRIDVQRGELMMRVKNEEEKFGTCKTRKRKKEKEEVYVIETYEVATPPPTPPPRAPPEKSTKSASEDAKLKSPSKPWRGHWPKPFKEVWRKKERVEEDPPPPERGGDE